LAHFSITPGEDFSHSLDMTSKIELPVISNEVRDLSELKRNRKTPRLRARPVVA
jgi:hypothetical protein